MSATKTIAQNTGTKRRPTVLVTDSRDQRIQPEALRSNNVRFVSVDSILASSSEIPSGIQRGGPLPNRRPSAPQLRRPSDQRLKNRSVVPSSSIPSRSSKVSEKLVLLPETEEVDGKVIDSEFDQDNNEAPTRDDEEGIRSKDDRETLPRKSYAERLPKSRRADKLPRVTAFCTAGAYRLQATSKFMKQMHAARTKLYDECLYCAYHLPLLPGTDGNRVRSSPTLKTPGGKAVLDVQIERSEQRDYHEDYFKSSDRSRSRDDEDGDGNLEQRRGSDGSPSRISPKSTRFYGSSNRDGGDRFPPRPMSPEAPDTPDMMNFAELFIFSYGVVVFWNFTARQEKDILADLTFATTPLGSSLMTEPMKEVELESEEFYFEYSPKTTRPRIYNDMITLRSGDHMIKLAMSHAVAQSTKLSRFEELMAITMREVEHVPKKLALTGTLGMKREEVLKMSGKLFKLRVDVNLSSNTLDTPDFFWDSEPALHPLYLAVREYLEIKQRVLILNERCRVFLDLAAILADHIADSNITRITWIIIILILLSIMVTLGEVTLRFSILAGNKGRH